MDESMLSSRYCWGKREADRATPLLERLL